MNKPAYLYHMRDPENSAGFGFGGYLGTTNNPKRRYREHMQAAAAGRHPNKSFQAMFDEANGNLKMHIVRKATGDQVLASEALIINRPNKHANVQAGGGPLRGLSHDELVARSGLQTKSNNKCRDWKPQTGSVSPRQAALIAAASVAIACGAYYCYRSWKKSKAGGSGSPSETAAPVSRDEEQRVEEEVAARRAWAEGWKKSKGNGSGPASKIAASPSLAEEQRVADELAARKARAEKMNERLGPPLHRRILDAISEMPVRKAKPDDMQRIAEEIAARRDRLNKMEAARKPLHRQLWEALIAGPDCIQSLHAQQLAEERKKRQPPAL